MFKDVSAVDEYFSLEIEQCGSSSQVSIPVKTSSPE